ncbi:MAG: PGPGW domain-containing protein [Planctomycetota bacterium]
MVDWIRDHTPPWIEDHALEIWVGSALMLLAGVILAPWWIARLPVDGLRRTDPLGDFREHHPVLRAVIWVVRNLVGIVVVVLGVLMLVLPGQGILTVLLGLGMMDFRGKRRIVQSIVKRKSVFASMNWIRRKAGKPELLPPD